MRKNELADALDKHLQGNASHLSSRPSLSDYYGRSSSPVKKEPKEPKELKEASNGIKSSATDEPESKVVRKPGRRKTIKEEEPDSPYVCSITRMRVCKFTRRV